MPRLDTLTAAELKDKKDKALKEVETLEKMIREHDKRERDNKALLLGRFLIEKHKTDAEIFKQFPDFKASIKTPKARSLFGVSEGNENKGNGNPPQVVQSPKP